MTTSPQPESPEPLKVAQFRHAVSAGFYSFGRARSIKARNHSMPNFSTFAHCAAVSRMERCSSLASGGVGGRPRGRFGSSIRRLYVIQKVLALSYLLNHNNSNETHKPEHQMTNRFQVLSISDDRDFCECCGKTGLKRVVFIRDTETDEVKHFGTTCANAPAKGFNLGNEIKAAISRHNNYLKTLNALAYYEYKRSGGKYIGNGDAGWKAADPALYQQSREAVISRGFNY